MAASAAAAEVEAEEAEDEAVDEDPSAAAMSGWLSLYLEELWREEEASLEEDPEEDEEDLALIPGCSAVAAAAAAALGSISQYTCPWGDTALKTTSCSGSMVGSLRPIVAAEFLPPVLLMGVELRLVVAEATEEEGAGRWCRGCPPGGAAEHCIFFVLSRVFVRLTSWGDM